MADFGKKNKGAKGWNFILLFNTSALKHYTRTFFMYILYSQLNIQKSNKGKLQPTPVKDPPPTISILPNGQCL